MAIISGGSLSGMASALQLHKVGFNVLVAEKREKYSRENILALREESMYSLANLSEDGNLLKNLLTNKQLTVNKNNISNTGTLYNVGDFSNSSSRFMGWMVPHEGMPARIPGRMTRHKPLESMNVDIPVNKTTEPLQHLDLAWPHNEIVKPISAKDWRYTDLTKIGADTLALAQVKDLEKGLNEYCIEQGINFVCAETSLTQIPGRKDYSAKFTMKTSQAQAHVEPTFPIDLICLAESANSKNSAAVSLQTVIPTDESVYLTNFLTKPSDAVSGFTGIVINPSEVTIALHVNRKDESVVNIGTRGKPREDISHDLLQDKLNKAKPMMEAVQAHCDMDLKTATYNSGRLDIALTRAMNTIESNVILVGDTAGAGSPIGGLGGSLALSAYPELIRRLVTDHRFSSQSNSEKEALAKNFRHDTAQVVNLRHGVNSEIMRKLGFYTEKANKHQLLQGVSSLFLLHDEKRKGLIKNPRRPCQVWVQHPAGEAWLRNEFSKIEANVKDHCSKPPRHVLGKR